MRLQDNPSLTGYNVKEMVDLFVGVAQQYANWTRGNEVMFLMGCDYQWEYAGEWFDNIDRLLKHEDRERLCSTRWRELLERYL